MKPAGEMIKEPFKGRKSGLFTNRQGKSIAGGVHMIDRLRAADGALCEHIRFAPQLALFVNILQRTEQIVAAIVLKGVCRATAVDQTILTMISVVLDVQLLLQFVDYLIGKIIHLSLQQLTHGIS